MRVLFVTVYDPMISSGPGNHIKNLSEALETQGVEVHVLAKGAQTKDLVVNGVNFHWISDNYTKLGKDLKFNLFLLKSINQLISKYKIDIVHGHSPATLGYALFLSRRVPLVVTLHGTSYGEIAASSSVPIKSFTPRLVADIFLIQPLLAVLTTFEYHFADTLIAVSNSIAQEAKRFYRLPKNKFTVIHNGVNLPTLLPFQNSKKHSSQTILFVGRLVWRKGTQYLIDALPQILTKYPTARLQIVGTGEQEKLMKTQVKKLNIGNSVKFFERVSSEKLFELINDADVYVQPSLYEPFSIALLEAMSMRKAIVTTNVNGTPEVIKNGEHGLLIDPKNSDQISAAITKILTNSDLKCNLENNAREKIASEFTWQIIAKQTRQLYRSLIKNNS